MEIGFYHATRTDADAVVPRLAEKALAGGHRVAVRSADRARLARLDQTLWTFDPASFIAHALDTHPHAARQPLLLTTADRPANAADLLVMLDGDLPADGFARVLYVFDDAARDAARAAWKALATAAIYWKQSDRGWTREAERAAKA